MNNYNESKKSMIILIINNFFKIYLSGFNNIYFANYTSVNLNTNLGNFVSQIKENSVIFLIFLFSFFISIFNFLKKKINIFDYIILYFFLFFILINKFPPDRVYVGIIYFFIFYLFFNCQNIEIRSKVLIYLFLSACFIQIILDKNIYREIATLKDKQLKLQSELNCKLGSTNFLEIEKHLYYYLFLEKCNKKRNLNEFLMFYRKN
jgi:hypothetical protein